MDSFAPMAATAAWSPHLPSADPSVGSNVRRSLGHVRSLSSISSAPNEKPRSPYLTPTHTPTKASSSTHLASIGPDLDDEMSTIPDPRTRALGMTNSASAPPSPNHPGLDDEVATLSTKLVNAINHQTALDDSLAAARHELDTARERIRVLESQNASQREMLGGSVWIRKQAVEAERRTTQAKIAEERQKRLDTEKSKKKIEQELENLTAALFEEANKMVIAAKEEAKADHEAVQRKNDQLKAQLADSESLLKSQQEQLSELKSVMESIVTERDDQTNATAPSSPGLAQFESREEPRPSTEAPSVAASSGLVDPSYPLSFSHLVQPVLRTDLASYDDFIHLTRVSRNRASSRVSSSSIGALNALTSFGLGGSTSSAHPSNASTTSLSAMNSAGSAPQSPNTPASAMSAASNASAAPLPSLKDTRFYKRVLAEDIEPTLRLDMAPGLSWLARRAVINSMAEGSLVVEPVPTTGTLLAFTKPQFYPCSLCGDSRKDPIYLRNHRFRTSEADSAQRHPLCKYCLSRVRSTCDFLGFLRMIKDGHWRADDEDHEKSAWEESVRLREQMFWSRIGGGVIPAPLSTLSVDLEKSPRVSQEEAAPEPSSLDNAVPEPVEIAPKIEDQVPTAPKSPIEEPHTPPEQIELTPSIRSSMQSLDAKSNAGSVESKRLSITIPQTELRIQ